MSVPGGQSVARLGTVDDRALGTSIRVVVTDAGRLGVAKRAVDAVLRDIDLACSRFREDSDLAALNRSAGAETTVGPLLARALAEGLRGARVTDGDVDPTVGKAIRLAGYDADFAAVAAEGGPLTLTVRPVPGWQTVRLDPRTRRVFVPAGVEVDLGATAKALAADLAAAAGLAAAGGGGILVSLGGDIALAGEPPDGGWTVAVSDDSNDPVESAQESIVLQSGAVASSSTRVRRWRRGGVELHHIIDPRTGCPARTPWRLATVVADSCVDANIASTAAIIRGTRAPAWLDSLRLPARLVAEGGDLVRVGGWPAPEA
jgi:thiamine biosynthesis lipoprotein